ncbi:kinase-associated protein B [Pullulanibacillus pueri]|uniref:Kinase n=1 Tax=Pullulanibacillus pueri TaxID=1437324 RepID=A0A8J3EM12_9BACL|nr:sporulation phosphorelay system protein KapB [Pullulanibacillus pueri]MBM7682327.1 kinase-associated protein B [Pullulanibacillus pueri]GGH80782.1 kinase [Pullulanibacillus pueri]
MKAELKPDALVKVRSKTGEYIARLVEFRNEQSAVVETLAVLKHPTQGDLHQPNETDVPLFHERRAHAFHEKVLVNISAMSLFEGEVPDYELSLKNALIEKMKPLEERDDLWAKKSYEHLNTLYKEYFK